MYLQLKSEVNMQICWSHHSTNFLLTNYSFGKSVRTSTLGMTQFFQQMFTAIISLIIHCITIPVGHKCTYTKLTVPLNSLENSRNEVMALEASDRIIDIIRVNWWCTCGSISRPTFNLRAYLLDIMGKSKEISEDIREKLQISTSLVHSWEQFPNA